MNPKFVVSHLDQQIGPYSEQELKMKWAAGEILPIDYVYDDAKEDWILLAERFSWASQPVSLDGSAPPPVTEDNIMKKTPPPARPTHSPALTQTSLGPTKPLVETLKDAVNVIKYTEITPTITPTKVVEPVKVAEPVKIPEPVKVVAAEKVSTAASTSMTPMPSAEVKLIDGEAFVDLKPLNPGRVQLIAHDDKDAIKVDNPHTIEVKAAEPAQIEWSFVSHQTVGKDVDVVVKALDSRGFQCAHYDDQYVVHIRGPVSHDVVVRMVGGYGKVVLNHTKAETWNLSLHYTGSRQVKLPEARMIDWAPGPAVRLVLDGPSEYLAGDPLKVKVRAVDSYGNLARTFQGTVVLEVKAS